MEGFIALGVLGLICWALYRAGKSIDSRKGFGVGRAIGRRRFQSAR